MDRDERQNDSVLSLDKDTQINVVVNSAEDEDTIDLGRILHNFKLKTRVFAWVLLLCLAIGICAPLVLYQFNKPVLTVSSVVTLNYEVPNPLLDPEKNPDYDPTTMNFDEIPLMAQVADLTAPDGEELDLNQVISSHVLSTALSGLELSQPVTLTNLRDNIKIDKILTEDSRRQQEVAASMIQDKNTAAYTQVQEISLTYGNQFVVSLTNGFGDADARVKRDLTDSELRLVLDRILDAYNDYLVDTYADAKLPSDEISIIDVDSLDALESLDLLRSAVNNLYDYCDAKSDTIKEYRSWRTGRSLNDLMKNLALARDINVDYLYADVYSNNIVRDKDAMIASYQYQLRTTQTALDKVNEDIANTQTLLDSYKNDEIYVSVQDSDTAKSTMASTNYYNNLMLQQAENYEKATALETTVANLNDRIDSLNARGGQAGDERLEEELKNALNVCRTAYAQIKRQMEEITASAFYTTYAEHSVAQGESESFLSTSMKKMVLGAAAGIAVALVLWFLSALAPELRTHRDEEAEEKEAIEA